MGAHTLNQGTGRIPTRQTQPNGKPIPGTIEVHQCADARLGIAVGIAWAVLLGGGLFLMSVALLAW